MNISWQKTKVFGLLVVSILLSALIAACSGGQSQPGTPPPISTTVGNTAAQVGKGYPAPSAAQSVAPTGAYPAPAATSQTQPLVQRGQNAVTFTTADGVTLAGTYYPAGKQGVPGVVLVHMVGGQQSDWVVLADLLQRSGLAVLTFDLRGHGKSGGSREWGKMTDDVAAAYRFLTSRPEVDGTRVALVGASIGANLALNFAAGEPAIKSLVLISPGLDYRGVKTEAAMKAYSSRPLLLVASKADTYAAQTVDTLHNLATGKNKMQLYDNAGHGTQMLGKAAGLDDLILNWLQETLG